MSDNKDITIKPRIFGADKFVLQNEFRQKTSIEIKQQDIERT